MVEEVQDLCEEHKRLSKLVEKMGKTNLGKGNEMLNMTRNPN